MSKTLGELIYANIENNEYLNEIYNNILYNYALKIFKLDVSQHYLNIIDALRFADILSKSVSDTRMDIHYNLAQEIVYLISNLYPKDDVVKIYTGSVLSSISNYRGLSMKVGEYTPLGVFDNIFEIYKKSLLQIPGSKDQYFFKSQKDVYRSLDNHKFSYSGPTSMGKSFVIRMFMKERISENFKDNYAIVVPTKALINETTSKIIDDFKKLLADKNYRIINNSGSLDLGKNHNFIFVLTPERLLYLLLENEDLELDYLFIDEAHKISSKDSRSSFYYKIINLLKNREAETHYIFSSPNIPNPDVYLQLILGNIDEKDNLATSYSPVCQIKFILDLVNHKIYIHNDHNKTDMMISDEFEYETLESIIQHIGNESQNIVYCNSTSNAIDFAKNYAKALSENVDSLELKELSKDIQEGIHNEYYLADLVLKGVAYHIGYLPNAIRLRIEDLFRKGLIKTVFCTSTLVEGVNLPADNLFVTSYKNGRSNMNQIDFKNLIGRVGRINYNLYGNVFLVCLDNKTTKEKFEKLINQEVAQQTLSVVSELTRTQKKHVVDYLLGGRVDLPKYPARQSNDNYALMRKFALILLKDIVSHNNSIVHKEFSHFLDATKEKKIRELFAGRPLDDDINISVDQVESLSEAIKKGLTYPRVNMSGYVDFDELMDFLEKMCSIFNWEKYEESTLGHKNRVDGKHGKLRWYAVILKQWISGSGLNSIMSKAIAYKREILNPTIEINGEIIAYNDSKLHKNIVISDTLNAIEDVILFRISNYFLRFSAEYKKINNISVLENDWYEYVEYGTMEPVTIFLQRNGFSRESAVYIKNHSGYLQYISGQCKILDSLLYCSNKAVCKEANEVIYNIPELFIHSS